MLSHIWYPSILQNPGYDALLFFLPNGIKKEKRNVIVVAIECRYSDESSSMKLDVKQDIFEKRVNAVQQIHADFGDFPEENMIFRLSAWRDPSKPRENTLAKLKDVANVIVCDKNVLEISLGPSLSHLVNNIGTL